MRQTPLPDGSRKLLVRAGFLRPSLDGGLPLLLLLRPEPALQFGDPALQTCNQLLQPQCSPPKGLHSPPPPHLRCRPDRADSSAESSAAWPTPTPLTSTGFSTRHLGSYVRGITSRHVTHYGSSPIGTDARETRATAGRSHEESAAGPGGEELICPVATQVSFCSASTSSAVCDDAVLAVLTPSLSQHSP
jgi:hypothetical protein